jgi:hypothetical protein
VPGIAVFDVGNRVLRPLVDLVGESAMPRVEERDAQVCSPAHVCSPPGRTSGPEAFRAESGRHNHSDGKSLHF